MFILKKLQRKIYFPLLDSEIRHIRVMFFLKQAIKQFISERLLAYKYTIK